MTAILEPWAPPGAAPTWRLVHRLVLTDGGPRGLRLVRFPTGWLASVDTDDGPTLGADASPYLAAHAALEPLGIDLVRAMTAIGPIAFD